ncbi:MAG TPA: energy-coupling factor ABC transporter permease [Synergistales bacterium]|nr:energy-coupling factor ABC transporter permease [Synergistales bacterium]
MHMADALLSPAVGGTMLAVTAGLTAYSARKLKESPDESRIPLMGVLGAFIFAAQMINFSIPATGSSGHLGGGMILAILLGPYAAFLVLASVLVVQALFFADGGILALGCNIFNLAFFPCFVAYPFIYRKIVGDSPSRKKILLGAILSAVAGLQLGAFSVVLETVASGISELPFRTFLLLMQPIHLAIGIVEGIVTGAVVTFVWKARPEVLESAARNTPLPGVSLRKVLAGLALAAIFTGGALSWFASTYPDGLEWSMAKTAGTEELEAPAERIHTALAALQEKLAFLPDYGFRPSPAGKDSQPEAAAAGENEGKWPAVDPATTVSGLVGGALTLTLAGGLGILLRGAVSRRK